MCAFKSYAKKNRSRPQHLRSLESLTIIELKKLAKSIQSYNLRRLIFGAEVDRIRLENAVINRSNEAKRLAQEAWEKQHLQPIEAMLVRREAALANVSVLGRLLGESTPVKADIGKIERNLEAARKRMPDFQRKPLKNPPRAPKESISLIINGVSTIFIVSDESSTAVNAWLEKRETEVNAKKQALEELRARAAMSEKERRAQASRLRVGLAGQLALVSGCPYCGSALSENSVHFDHIYPVAKGGHSTPANLVYICNACNLRKGKLTLRSFLTSAKLGADDVYARLTVLGKDF